MLPFHLSESDPQLQLKLQQEHEKVLKEQCTFQPRTNETIGAEGLKHLLDDDDDDDSLFDFQSYGDDDAVVNE